MALVVYEQQETRSDSFADGRETGTRKFRVYDDATQITTTETIRKAFGGGSLPAIGDEFPGSTTMFARSFSITHVPDSLGLWEVEFSYENVEPGEYQPQEIGYTEISIEYAAEFRLLWRSDPGLLIPSFGTPTTPGTDPGTCQGTPIDAAGDPTSVLVRSSTITITETVAASTMADRSLRIRALRGTRNLTQFQGAAIGQVLYLGAGASRVSLDKFQITHRFSQDQYMHLIQSPVKGPDSQVLLKESSPGILTARGVNWRQPFPTFGEFNLLSENF